MRLSADSIRKLLRGMVTVYDKKTNMPLQKKLIDPFRHECLTEDEAAIEGSVYDLTLDQVGLPNPKSSLYIGTEERRPLDVIPLLLQYADGKEFWLIPPMRFVRLVTLETVNIPPYLEGVLTGRASFEMDALPIFCSNARPNYQGKLTVGCYNFHTQPAQLDYQCRFLSIGFAQFDSDKTDGYRGPRGEEDLAGKTIPAY